MCQHVVRGPLAWTMFGARFALHLNFHEPRVGGPSVTYPSQG